jgi:hypothetical protein
MEASGSLPYEEMIEYKPRVLSSEEVLNEMEIEIKEVCQVSGVSYGNIQ